MDKNLLGHSVQNQSEDKKLDHITLSDGTTKLLLALADWTGYTPMPLLIKAIFKNVDEDRQKWDSLVKLLIEYGAHPLTLSHNGESALLLAHNLAREVPYEGNYYGMDERRSAVFLPIADMLLKHQPTYQVNPVNSEGFSHFHYACMRNQVDVVEKFLDNGIDVNHTANITLPGGIRTDGQDATNFTPLHFAMYYRSVEVAYLLVERGANVNAVNGDGETPLHIALTKGLVDLHLFEILLRHGADINARVDMGCLAGAWAGPPICYLFRNARDITHEQLQFFRSHGSTKELIIHPSMVFHGAMRNAKPCDRAAILEELIDFFGIKNDAQNHSYLIQNIVDVHQEGELNLSFYTSFIQRFIDMGCNIDQQNMGGQTALHRAYNQGNLEAIEALLLLGANVNIVDEEDEPPIAKYWCFSYERKSLTSEMLAAHVWKMKFAGLKVHELCGTAMMKIHKKFPLDENFKRRCKEELNKLSKEDIGQSLTLQSFLREWSAIIEYPTMPRIQREYVDQLFANSANLRQSFPQFSGLLTMQYRKALDRLKLHGVAMDLLPSVLQVDMPYLCLENILKYFDNNELKYFVEWHEDPVQLMYKCRVTFQ